MYLPQLIVDQNQFISLRIILLIICACLFFGFYSLQRSKIKRILKQRPLKRISEVNDGEHVRIQGEIEIIRNPLIAPLSSRKYAYYSVVVEHRVTRSRFTSNRRVWKTLIEEEKSGFFLIKDGNYFARIKHGNLLKHIIQDVHLSSGIFNDAPEKINAFLAKHQESSIGPFGFNWKMRYKEGVLEPGEKVVASGVCHWKQAHEIGLPAEYGRILEISTASDTPSVISDDPELMQAVGKDENSQQQII